MSKTVNIMITGVGGQGSLLASRIIGEVVMSAGYDVKVSEVHGMAQRGGSVVTYVRYAEEGTVASPVICKGEADYLISFEILEAARWLSFLRKGGTLVTNTQKILPMPVITGQAAYPENIDGCIEAKGVDIVAKDALSIARDLGNEKAVNVVLIGVFAKKSPFSKSAFIDAINKCVPEKFRELNLKAFEKGYEA
jgi:indolepyruvate ferredoxin oxidoreductase beta subunit